MLLLLYQEVEYQNFLSCTATALHVFSCLNRADDDSQKEFIAMW